MNFTTLKKAPVLFLLITILSLTACSNAIKSSKETTDADASSTTTNTNKTVKADTNSEIDTQKTVDSLEKFNRKIYRVNASLDKHIFKPVAKGYEKIMPAPINTSITNFFKNLGDVENATNNLLQLKIGDALKDTERFIFNSTFGIAGIFDIATEMGLQRHNEDFGQTLAKWGVGSGPYVMLPIFGPSTLRDATAKFSIDALLDPAKYTDEKYQLLVLEKLDKRADILSEEEAFKDMSDDQYIALRDAWLQRRQYLIRDGKVDQKEQSDLIDELEDLDDN